MKVINDPILNALREGRILWSGGRPPRSDMVDGSAVYDPARDFRLPPDHHQAFDLVYLVDKNLAEIKQWPLVLDEALRALRPGGILVVRTSETPLMSLFQMANFIQKWTAGRYEMLSQVADDQRFLISIRLIHEVRRKAAATEWSFGLITSGDKPASVAAFIDSVAGIRRGADDPFEVLICGPERILIDLGERAGAVRWVPQPNDFADRGWITRKKNLLAQAAGFENVLIVHDRYIVPPDFQERVVAFGGDFDLMVARQKTVAGQPLPDWVMVSDPLNWTTPGWMEFGDYHPFAYGNGGATLAKAERLRTTPWSEMLFWGQAEDVEIARRLSDVGAVSRPARNVTLLSEQPRSGFIEGFERLPWLEDVYAQTHRPECPDRQPLGPMGTDITPTPAFVVDTSVALCGYAGPENALSAGLVFAKGWEAAVEGLTWKGAGLPAFSLKLASLPAAGVRFSIRFAEDCMASAVEAVCVNSSVGMAEIHGEVLSILIPADVVTTSNIIHLRLQIDPSCARLALQAVAILGQNAGDAALRRP